MGTSAASPTGTGNAMNQPLSKFGDGGHSNNLTPDLIVGPGGELTNWRRAHPNGDPIVWQEDEAQNKDLLRRFRGGPFQVDQFADSAAYDLRKQIYRCEYEGFTGVVYRVYMHLGSDKAGGPQGGYFFMVFSIDIPRSVPRTAIRPTGMMDSLIRGRGFQGVKTDDKEFDKHYHVQTEDEQFVKAMLTPTFKQYLRGHQLPRVLSFVFDGNTLSTWNRAAVLGQGGDPYLLDYMSMVIDYLVQIWKSMPPELSR
jgi:hypothetical protein